MRGYGVCFAGLLEKSRNEKDSVPLRLRDFSGEDIV
jgi:hypothetical protein